MTTQQYQDQLSSSSSSKLNTSLPIVIIGAGPIGLATAAHLVSQGQTPLVLEAGASVGASIRQWAHVRVFSPWSYNLDPLAVRLLKASGWQAPDPQHLPTGAELLQDYLQPLAALPAIAQTIKLNTRVVSVSRAGLDKLKTAGREETPFRLLVETLDSQTGQTQEAQILARAVVDASGTYHRPNPLGADGAFALGERAAAERIFYGLPDIAGAERARYAHKRVMVVGSGHSAFQVLLELDNLMHSAPDTQVIWVVRRPQSEMEKLYAGFSSETLAARGNLSQRIRQLIESGKIRLVTGFRLESIQVATAEEALIVSGGQAGQSLPPVDQLIAVTGFRPDLSVFEELRINLDTSLDSPVALADLIDPNVHTCGSVPVHGEPELRHPEKDFYIVGMKSYGRAPTFLMRTGYEQVRSVVAALTGQPVVATRQAEPLLLVSR